MFIFATNTKTIDMKKSLLLVVAAGFLFASCGYIGGKRVRGNSNLTTSERSVGDFNGVNTSGSFDVYVSSGPASVKIEAEENLIPYIETFVEGNVLKIKTKQGFWLKTNRQVKIFVTAPSFSSIHSSGSGNIVSQGKISDSNKIELSVTGSADITVDLDAPEVKSEITGSGNVKLTGTTKTFSGEIRGSGDIKAYDLQSEDTDIQISGSGNADVSASVKLKVHIAGSGDVRYKGDPQLDSRIAGSGSVKKVS